MSTLPKEDYAPDSSRQPWLTAWLLIAPFAIWLLLDKTAKFGITLMDPSMYGMPRDQTPREFLTWMLFYGWFRLSCAFVAALALQKMFFRRRPLALWPLWALVWIAMTAMFAWYLPGRTFQGLLTVGTTTAVHQILVYLDCIWRELATASLMALVVGLLFRCLPGSLHWGLRSIVMAIVVVLCMLMGADFAYESAIGQPANAAVVLFAASSWQDMMPLVKSEVTATRVFAIAGGGVFALVWFAWFFWLRHRPARSSAHARLERSALLAGAIGSLALLAPTISTGVMPLERHTEGTVIAFLKTTASSASREAALRVEHEFEVDRQPPWHSIDMTLKPTVKTRQANVVVIMLESVRAISTTVHQPSLPTTPFLEKLSKNSLMVADMSVVYPRTNGAWMAILGGQYPLTIEGVTRWTAENKRQRRVHGLPFLLGEQGYATAFFTPTDLNFLDEIDVVRALEFEHIVSDPELRKDGDKRTNYLGGADESMIDPILEWSAAQQKAGRPFLTAIMTNVGHHPYKTPETWKKVQFPGVTDERLNDYYNCLLYIDGFLDKLIQGYAKLGLRDNTIFVILGDHGQSFGEHGLRQVYNGLYQEGVQTPALIYAPGMPELKGVIGGARQQIDVLPTVLDLLGYTAQGGRLPGVSLLSPPDPQRNLFMSTSMDASALAARQGSLKYIYRYDRNPMEVFDLSTDATESRPLAVPEEQLAHMKREMLEWKAKSELSMYARREPNASAWARR
jgi:arylsulfatase A-like enzyme